MTRILISNDDGYQAPGIQALFEAVRDLGQVEVIAPEQNNSAKSNAITINAPLHVHTAAANGFRFVTGTPADCVHLALSGLLDYRPDLVLSGINNGANMGDDTLYSGTVGAAMEGYLFGVPAIAFSLVDYGWKHIEDAARKARDLVQMMLAQKMEQSGNWLLNVNIPSCPYEEMGDFRISRLGKRHAAEPVTRMISPRGETLYWIGAAGDAKDAGEGTDFYATTHGDVSVTPLQIDLTEHDSLRYWSQGLQNAEHALKEKLAQQAA